MAIQKLNLLLISLAFTLYLPNIAEALNYDISSAFVQITRQPSYSYQSLPTKQEIKPRVMMCSENFVFLTGGIFHKPFEPVLDNERCVWIISVPEALGYEINVQFLSPITNQPGSGQGLVLTGITWNDTEPIIVKNFVPKNVGQFNISDSNAVVVSFFSGDQTGTQNNGIVLEYKALFEGSINATSPSSRPYLVETPTFNFVYPSTGIVYTSKELIPFSFPPTNNIYTGAESTVHWNKKALEAATCNDSLFVLKFIANIENEENIWEDGGRLCGDMTNATIVHDDIVVVLFQSNALNTNYGGFDFSFLSC